MTKNILLVDKDKEILDKNKSYLESEGLTVSVAGSAKEALEAIKTSKPDMVVTEIMLEQVDSGFSLCHTLKKEYPGMPVFILSDIIRKTGINFSISSKEEKNWILADEFIDKPITPARLLCMINRHFN